MIAWAEWEEKRAWNKKHHRGGLTLCSSFAREWIDAAKVNIYPFAMHHHRRHAQPALWMCNFSLCAQRLFFFISTRRWIIHLLQQQQPNARGIMFVQCWIRWKNNWCSCYIIRQRFMHTYYYYDWGAPRAINMICKGGCCRAGRVINGQQARKRCCLRDAALDQTETERWPV